MDVCSPSRDHLARACVLTIMTIVQGGRARGLSTSTPNLSLRLHYENPTDALNLLALAADVDRASKSKNQNGKNKNKRRADGRSVAERDEGDIGLDLEFESTPIADDATGHGVGARTNERRLWPWISRFTLSPPIPSRLRPPSLGTFELIKQNILNQNELSHLTSLFFSRVHVIFPMMSYNRIPRTGAELARFEQKKTRTCSLLLSLSQVAWRGCLQSTNEAGITCRWVPIFSQLMSSRIHELHTELNKRNSYSGRQAPWVQSRPYYYCLGKYRFIPFAFCIADLYIGFAENLPRRRSRRPKMKNIGCRGCSSVWYVV